jgi:hypothetical protein
MLGRPAYPRFLLALKENQILNCPVTLDDARRAERIYGKDIAFIKGKTTAQAATAHIPDYTPVTLPADLLDLRPNVTLCIDLFYMLGLGFCLSTSRELRYLSCHPIADRFKPTLHSCISTDLSVYRARGFVPTAIHADGEFNTLQQSFPNVHFTICSANDHVPEIERAISTVKESMRTIIHGMPFARLPRVLVKELAMAAVSCLNMLPHPDGVSLTMSPATIVTGAPKTDYRTMRLEFGSYVQVYDGTSNDTKSRTLGAIATNPTGNASGDYYFMSLATGHRIHRRSWTSLPISDSVISRVEAIALNENMPLVDTTVLLTEYDLDDIVEESTYNRDYIPPALLDPDSDHDLTSDAYTSDDDSTTSDDNGHHPDFDDAPSVTIPLAPLVHANEEQTHDTIEIIQPVENKEHDTPIEIQPVENEERGTNEKRGTPIENEERNTPTTQRLNSLRPKQSANYQYRYGFVQTTASPIAKSWQAAWKAIENTPPPTSTTPSANEMKHIHRAITGLMFTQMSAHKGIKKHGQSALDALRKEFLQFKTLDVLEPLDAFLLTKEQIPFICPPILVKQFRKVVWMSPNPLRRHVPPRYYTSMIHRHFYPLQKLKVFTVLLPNLFMLVLGHEPTYYWH